MISGLLSSLLAEFSSHILRDSFILFLVVPLLYLLVNEFIRWSARFKGFNGPRNWPVVGNIPDIRYNASEKYREWAQIYGDVYQIQLGNVPILVVNSAAAAKAIFGGNSQALSSRPVFWTFHKVRQPNNLFYFILSTIHRSFRTLRERRLEHLHSAILLNADEREPLLP